MAYVTLSEFKQNVPLTGTTEDVNLQFLLDAASEQIDKFCHVTDGFEASDTASAREFPIGGYKYVSIDYCTEITKVEVRYSPYNDYEIVTTTDYMAYRGSYSKPQFNKVPYTGIMFFDTDFKIDDYRDYKDWNGIVHRVVKFPMFRVTARWGYADIAPDPIKLATIIQASRWLKRGQSAWSDTAGNVEMQTMSITQVLDPQIKEILMLSGYVMPQI